MHREADFALQKLPSGRLHVVPQTEAATDPKRASLCFRGVHEGTLFPVMQQGSEMVLQVRITPAAAPGVLHQELSVTALCAASWWWWRRVRTRPPRSTYRSRSSTCLAGVPPTCPVLHQLVIAAAVHSQLDCALTPNHQVHASRARAGSRQPGGGGRGRGGGAGAAEHLASVRPRRRAHRGANACPGAPPRRKVLPDLPGQFLCSLCGSATLGRALCGFAGA